LDNLNQRILRGGERCRGRNGGADGEGRGEEAGAGRKGKGVEGTPMCIFKFSLE